MIYDTLLTKDVNPFYVSKYINFINNCYTKNTMCDLKLLYVEHHHILPKSIFPEFKNLREHTWNCALLTPRQHFISHIILSKIFVDIDNCRKMVCALLFMNKSHKRTSRQFANLRENLSVLMKTNNPMFDYDTKIKSITKLQQYWTPERRVELSRKRIGKHTISQEAKEKLSLLWTGVKKPPRQDSHTAKIREKTARYIFHTPFGDFYSPNLAAQNSNNINGFSRYIINKKCKTAVDGFSVTELDKKNEDARGKYLKTDEHIMKIRIKNSKGIFHTPFGDFYSSLQAAASDKNKYKLSHYKIKQRCLNGKFGFSFTPKNN